MRYLFALHLIIISQILCAQNQPVTIYNKENNVRVKFGIEKISNELINNGYKVLESQELDKAANGFHIYIGISNDKQTSSLFSKKKILLQPLVGKESFSIKSSKNEVVIYGSDPSGVLYGCMELASIIKQNKTIPNNINTSNHPEMVMRGACIGLQKTVYLPGHDVYEYPYTPENFPWFYDKQLWIKYLDMLVENRMNSLYLWNGHPFASLVKLKDYPFALEVDDETFKKNEEIFSFLTKEADKRGIFVIQMFYNIIVSKPFADHYGIKTQDRNRPITPEIADYTRKSIAAFVEKYPNVGLLICLGEAMNTEEDDVTWFTQTIIPGVKDGLKALGRTDEPPIILRAHDTNAKLVIDKSLPIYKNLYTMHKYNGESLTTYEPRGPWSKIHQDLSSLGSVHIENVHILANLEPFRYASPEFIRKSVLAMHNVHGANGLHVYPQASYWDWPYSADNTSPRLLQIDRDNFWYEAWARYAWNCHRDTSSEHLFWNDQYEQKYGCKGYGNYIREAYDQSGEIAPKLLRRFGITDGNRQTLLLGMFMSQLVNPSKYTYYQSFYDSNGPLGEILIDYAAKEWKKEPHVGETPPQIIAEVVRHGQMAVDAIDKVAPYVTSNVDEFNRLKNDIYCYREIAECFANKVNAAMLILRYQYSKDMADLEKATPYIESSLKHYQKLVELTRNTYLYANSMQTQQRRIPIGGNNGRNKTWEELLPLYQEEFDNFKKNIAALKAAKPGTLLGVSNDPFIPVSVKLLDTGTELYPLQKGLKIFSDKSMEVKIMASELTNLSAMKFNFGKLKDEARSIHFTCDKPVSVVVGYFATENKEFLQAPKLETDAHANDYGQAEIRIANAIDIQDMPPVNIHTYTFPAGENTLNLSRGIVLVLGFMDASQKIKRRDAGLGISQKDGVDWLFY
jgi:hypothetical protein